MSYNLIQIWKQLYKICLTYLNYLLRLRYFLETHIVHWFTFVSNCLPPLCSHRILLTITSKKSIVSIMNSWQKIDILTIQFSQPYKSPFWFIFLHCSGKSHFLCSVRDFWANCRKFERRRRVWRIWQMDAKELFVSHHMRLEAVAILFHLGYYDI